jgi:hypothetical protein
MLARFLNQIRLDAYDAAHEPGVGNFRLTSLLDAVLDRLEESGVFADCHAAFFKREGPNLHAEAHAYSVDTEDEVLSVFYFLDANEADPFASTWEPTPVAKESIERAFRRLEAFLKLVRSARLEDLEESQPAAELVALLKECLATGRQIAFCVVATGTISERAVLSEGRDGVDREVWDLIRLARMCSGSGDEPLSIDFRGDFGCTLPCLITPKAVDGIQVLLTCIPGTVLANIYHTYRARLLERNVRSFLQLTGKVNKGIRDTLLTSPDRFLPYNNGLSGTASRADLEEHSDGLARITAVHDFQIVNGGQTTATLAAAARRDHADLSRVSVPMKLTIVPPEQVDELVPLISRYANTQNRIQEADFSANHPWHVALERISRDTWTPATQSAPRGTRWYFERSRGQYADDLAAIQTPAGKRGFRAENPPSQKFTKTDLAKFLLSWDQRPFIVSRGAQKCFVSFMTQLTKGYRPAPDRDELRRIAAQGILFHTTEKLCGELEFKGYRANVVTYAIAKLSHELQRRLPWEEIWAHQELPKRLLQLIKLALLGIRDVIVRPPGGRNVTEWCKGEECWSAVLNVELDLALPETAEWQPHTTFDALPSGKPLAQGPLLDAVESIPAEVWFAVAKWAKDTNSLMPWQRGLAFSLGKLESQGRAPTVKQSTQGMKLLGKAIDLGFQHQGVEQSHIDQIREHTAS